MWVWAGAFPWVPVCPGIPGATPQGILKSPSSSASSPSQQIQKPGREPTLQIRMPNAKTQGQIRGAAKGIKSETRKQKSQPARDIKRTLSGAVPVLGHCPRCRVGQLPRPRAEKSPKSRSENLRLCPPPLAVTPAAFASDRASRSRRLSGKARRPTACLRSKIPTLTPDAPLSGCRFAVIIQTARYKHLKSLLQTLLAGAAGEALGKGP